MAGEHELDDLRTLNAELKARLGGVQTLLREILPLRTQNEHRERENSRLLERLKEKVDRALALEPHD